MIMIRKDEVDDTNYDEEEDREEITPIAGSIVARASRTHTVWKSHLETVAIEEIDSFWHVWNFQIESLIHREQK